MYPGFYYTGDGGHRDEKGYWQITGRMDDVINVTGHRLGTAEVEDILDDHPEVAETAVVGYPHEIKGEGIYAYVVLKESSIESKDQLMDEMKSMVKTKIAGYAVPDYIQVRSKSSWLTLPSFHSAHSSFAPDYQRPGRARS